MMAQRRAPGSRATDHSGPLGAMAAPFVPGGQIADLQAEIERRMRADLRLPAPDVGADRIETLVHRLSVAGGYVALATGYVAAVAGWFYLA